MVLLAFITDPSVISRILEHLGLPATPPPLAPAKDPFDDSDIGSELELELFGAPAQRHDSLDLPTTPARPRPPPWLH